MSGATPASVLSGAVKRAARVADRIRPSEPGITVLIYHRVGGGTGSRVDLPTAEFRRQLAHIREAHRVLSLDEAANALEAGVPRTGVVVTFDDGTPDWVDHVLPALHDHGVPATFYLATDFVDRGVPFPSGPAIGWAGVRELASSPLVTIGSHTHTHALLDRVDAATAARELDRSTERIAAETGVEARHFAYPKALAGSPDADVAVRCRFRTAAVSGTRANPVGSTDLHRLRRTPVQTTDGERGFAAKAAGGMWFEDTVRGIINRARYQGANT